MTVIWVILLLTALTMGAGAWFGRRQLLQHPLRAFALLLIAVIVGYLMWTGYRADEVLASPGWCRTALGAQQASPEAGKVQGSDACLGLLTIQLKSVSTNSHIYAGSFALCLLALVVIMLAGGRIDFGSKIVDFSIGKEEAARRAAVAAADKVASDAQTSADEVKQNGAAPPPELRGPAMPEPK